MFRLSFLIFKLQLVSSKKVWFLIFLIYSFSIGYVLQHSITTKIENASATFTQNHTFDSCHIVENNYTPYQIQQISSCPLQVDVSFDSVSGIIDLNHPIHSFQSSLFDYDVKSRLQLIIKTIIYPHHTFW